ncbi:hypothetical protein GCM10028784_04490 [Myceligenerans cantabricum]
MRRTAAVVALAAALSLTGCSLPSTGPGTADAVVEAPEETLTKEAAGEQYLQITAPYDGVLEQFEAAVNDQAPLEEQSGLAAAVGAALQAESAGLRASAWPEEMAGDATALADAAEQAAAHWEQASSAGTTQEVMKHVDQAMEVDAADAADSIREALGLPADEEE